MINVQHAVAAERAAPGRGTPIVFTLVANPFIAAAGSPSDTCRLSPVPIWIAGEGTAGDAQAVPPKRAPHRHDLHAGRNQSVFAKEQLEKAAGEAGLPSGRSASAAAVKS